MNLIKIKSYKRNPLHGITHIPGRQRWTFRCKKLPFDFIINKNAINIYQMSDESYVGEFIRSDFLKSVLGNSRKYSEEYGLVIEMDTDLIEIASKDSNPYIIKYENPIITCNHCGKKFHFKELRDEEFYDGRDEYYLTDICPLCHLEGCCEYAYETIKQAKERGLNETKNIF